MDGEDETLDWYGEDTATFGDRLAGARERAGLSQKALAARLGVRLTTLRHWEEDLAAPRANRLQMLAGMLGVSLTWLLTAEGDGIDGPPEAGPAPDMAAILSEMRDLRRQIAVAGDRLESLENRLRQSLQGAA